MPIMIPDSIPASASNAEVSIFETLKSVAQRNWEVLHGVEIPSLAGSTRPIDFVIFIPNQLCVICIVVNPSTNPDSFESLSDQNLEPAKEIMEKLKTLYPSAYLGAAFPLSFGYAAVLPNPDSRELEIIIPNSDGGIISEPLGNLEPTLEGYAGTLNLVWGDLNEADPDGIDWDEWEQSWDKAQRALHKLRFDLVATGEIITTIATRFHDNLETHCSQLLDLTKDQLKVLRLVGCEPPPTILPEPDDQINGPESIEVQPRCVIDGAAGTGKTVLAIEIAKQLCEDGKTVGLLCSNPYLSQRFVNWAETLSGDNGGKIIAGTPAKLPLRVFKEGSSLNKKHQGRIDDSPGLEGSLKLGHMNDGWQQFITDTIEDLDTLEQGRLFDYLIVDEAQNLCDEMFLNLQNALLKGRLKDGSWIMFGDFTNQRIVSPKIKMDWAKFANYFTNQNPDSPEINTKIGTDWEKVVEVLRQIGIEGARLEVNCRNTHEIADTTTKLVRLGSPPMLGVHGPHVQIEYFNSQENLTDILDNLISDWQNRNFQSKQIILLSSGTGGEFSTEQKYSGWHLLNIRDVTEDSSSREDETLRYSDVYDFQGLESDLAILVIPKTEDMVKLADGLTQPQADHLNSVLYTGMSRAKAMLVIVADELWKRTLENRVFLYNRRREIQQAK